MHRLRRVSRCFAILLAAIVVLGETSPADVPVRGYTRRDGTHVRPHHRSSPDGIFGNNWSTKGNTNPYTGMPGTKVTPPSGSGGRSMYSPSGSAPFGNYGNLGVPSPTVNPYVSNRGARGSSATSSGAPTRPSSSPAVRGHGPDHPAERSAHDERRRILQATILESLGHNANWQDHSYAELVDMTDRIRMAYALARIGHSVDWKAHSYMDMIDMACRIRSAKELKKLGYEINWQDYTHAQLLQYRLELYHLRSPR